MAAKCSNLIFPPLLQTRIRRRTLWEGRYKATLIDSETYLLTCMRYIELNPVRAGRVSHPREYKWSSYHRNAHGQPDELITPYLEYRRLGKTDQERQAAYRQLFKHHIAERDMTEIRETTNKAWVLGSARFKQRIEQQLARPVQPSARGGDRKSQEFKSRHT